jgi:hypothetical protein
MLLLAATAAAHTPIFLTDQAAPGVHERATIQDPERSWAIYGRLAPGAGQADVIPIEAKQGQRLYLQLLVPQKKSLREFKPRVVLLGPGLTGAAPANLPAKPAPGQGALVLPVAAQPRPLYEGFTQMHYWVLGQLRAPFPETGRYALVVDDPVGHGGPYTVALGEREAFGPLDLLTFPLVWVRSHVWLWK